jgi:predicted nucleotide-binding protein
LDRAAAIKLIQQRIAEGEKLHGDIAVQSGADGWANKVEHSVRRVLKGDEDWIGKFLHVKGSVSSTAIRRRELAQAAVGRTLDKLRSLIDILEEAEEGELATAGSSGETAEASNEIFVVHGHDEGMREAIARFLEKLGYRPVILHEQANRGRTVIEKVEAHGGVGFAVVLLSADDLGRANNETDLEARARQNVLLELGYFMGRLGRPKVCTLMRGEVKFPSDFAGVVYTAFDDGGGWRTKLAHELQEAGYVVDWNRVMGK